MGQDECVPRKRIATPFALYATSFWILIIFTLQLSKDGIESTPNPPSRINQDLNFSLVNLNLVATTKAKVPADPPIPVATVHHKQQKQRQNSFDDSSSRASWNRGRAQGVAQHHQKKIEFQPNQHRYGSTLNASVATYSPMHQQVGGAPSSQSLHVPQIYQQYSDTGSLYSYPPQHHDQRRQFLPDPQYSSQQHFIYQQFHDLQQRHAHQMILLQQQQESQFRDLAQTSLISDSRTESFESGADYPVPTTIGGMLPNSSQYNTGVYSRPPSMQSYLPAPHPSPPHRQLAMNNFEYQYDSLGLSPERNDYRGDEQQLQGNTGSAPTTYASVISPPMSPTQSSRPAPQAPPRQYPDGKHA
jgi:hypothetical protein